MMNCEKVFDLRNYASINNTRSFFLDTNVLYWYTYPRFSQPSLLSPTARVYYNFIDNLTAAGNPLVTSIYNLTELLNVIEKNEYDIYCKLHPEIPINKKDFRKIPEERKKMGTIMQATLNNVHGICSVIEFNFTSSSIDEFVLEITDHRCDVFDHQILRNCINTNNLNVVSDDGDFSTMEKISLFTANENVLLSSNT